MRAKLTVTLLLAVFTAVLPASALADHNWTYLGDDGLGGGVHLITQEELLEPFYFDGSIDNSTLGATGGEPEPGEQLVCDTPEPPPSEFGQSWWWEFTPPSNGLVTVTAAGYDTVIWIVPFTEEEFLYDAPDAECDDDPTPSNSQSVSEYVFANRSYNIQVGGFEFDVGQFRSGALDLTVRFERDIDGDRVIDRLDRCPSVRGTSSGCPPPPPPPRDSDGDGIPDSRDACPSENSRARDENDNGCLDLRRITAKWGFKPGRFYVRSGGRNRILGLSVTKLSVSRVPAGATVTVQCSRRACKRQRKRAGRSGAVRFGALRGKKLRAGVKMTVRATAPGYVGDARVYRILRNNFRRADRCLSAGSTRLSKSCSTLR